MGESTIYTDKGRVARHIVPLIGKRTVKDFSSSDAGPFQRDVIAGKSAADVKTKLSGRATGGKVRRPALWAYWDIFSYAVREWYQPDNPINGIVRPKDGTREWRLDDAGCRRLGKCLEATIAAASPQSGKGTRSITAPDVTKQLRARKN